ncbi:MAG: TlpA disulfide reductase family protein [Candidatus Sedimenticola sp. PURPLELP]
MRLRNPAIVATLVLMFGIVGWVLYQELVTSESYAAPVPATVDSESAQLYPRLGIKAAADRVDGFNLLSNNPSVPEIEMYDEDGRPVTFARFKGKVALFNLWATWCPPCIREMPDLNALQAQYKEHDFVVVPVASGRQGEEEPADFLRKRGLSDLITYYDPGSQFLRTFNLETLPVTFLIDRDGNMRGGAIGLLDWSSAEAKALIESLLNERET